MYISRHSAPLEFAGRPAAKERLVSEREGVIIAQKRQWPDVGIFLGTGREGWCHQDGATRRRGDLYIHDMDG